MKDALKKGHTGIMTLFILDEKSRFVGKMDITNCSSRKFYSFLDLKTRNLLNVVPIVGVDYSLANLTFDEGQYCIHTLKEGAPNDYISALKGVIRSFTPYSKFKLAYGFGARTIPGEGPACNLFSMTGDYNDPFIDTESEIINSYSGTIKSVRLALPVNYSKIIRFV